jgi:hypothetical protein
MLHGWIVAVVAAASVGAVQVCARARNNPTKFTRGPKYARMQRRVVLPPTSAHTREH